DCRLRNIVSWLGIDLLSKLGAFLCSAMRTNKHSVAPGLAHRFHHVLIQPLADVVTLSWIGHQKRFNALQNRILIEIVANDLGHKSIDGFVVGDSGSERICESYVSSAIRIEKTHRTQG